MFDPSKPQRQVSPSGVQTSHHYGISQVKLSAQ
ncbi:hypothetical protein SAMN05216581_3852 [Pseudomonas asplenii]|uniref:Uncharacterized protein n=1 Tax=Pseudomonas asplenii TaxID=53407 RepID=A0A1H6NYC1_9PSED|nr:hypothetical protein SAMN05216581_3852 [Pseudomonas fuscovaginae]